MTRLFKRTIENFVCENCGIEVKGNGYTNHCPQCLWSKHVDINPGDRTNPCKGLMKPVSYEVKGGEVVLTQRCEVCGDCRNIKLSSQDNTKVLFELGS